MCSRPGPSDCTLMLWSWNKVNIKSQILVIFTFIFNKIRDGVLDLFRSLACWYPMLRLNLIKKYFQVSLLIENLAPYQLLIYVILLRKFIFYKDIYNLSKILVFYVFIRLLWLYKYYYFFSTALNLEQKQFFY